MSLPKLPTDNLYKFMSIFGLIICLYELSRIKKNTIYINWIVSFVGASLFLGGLLLWYYRTQKYKDVIIKNNARFDVEFQKYIELWIVLSKILHSSKLIKSYENSESKEKNNITTKKLEGEDRKTLSTELNKLTTLLFESLDILSVNEIYYDDKIHSKSKNIIKETCLIFKFEYSPDIIEITVLNKVIEDMDILKKMIRKKVYL